VDPYNIPYDNILAVRRRGNLDSLATNMANDNNREASGVGFGRTYWAAGNLKRGSKYERVPPGRSLQLILRFLILTSMCFARLIYSTSVLRSRNILLSADGLIPTSV